MTKLLDAVGIGRNFGSVRALVDVSLSVDTGERLALLGPNGSGKTTFFNVVSGSLRPNGGTVVFQGRDVTGMPMHRLAHAGMVRTFQHASVFPSLTPAESVRVACETGGRPVSEVDQILELCGLTAMRDVVGAELPYGIARRLNVAIAIATKPVLLMLDEPAAGLNDDETVELRDLLVRVNLDGVTMVVVDHDMSFISGLCTRAVVLSSGSVLAEGTVAEIQSDDDVRRLYLGESFAQESK